MARTHPDDVVPLAEVSPSPDSGPQPTEDTTGITYASLDLDSVIHLYPLTYLDEGDEVTVGRPDVDAYYVLPADGAALIRQLVDGSTLREAQSWYAAEYGETVDISEFLETLHDLEFIAEMDQQPAEIAGPVRWQRLGRALFSPVAWAAYAALISVAVVLMVRHPDLAPRNKNVFFTRYLTLMELVVFLGQFPLLLLHESFHALAGRRLGLRSTLGVSRRFYYIVFETRMDGLVSVPRRSRYLPMLAGILMDVLVISVLTEVAYVVERASGGRSLVSGIALALAFTTGLRLLWQLYFFLGTDLYYVAVTVSGCVDLQSTARTVLRNRVNRLIRRPDRIVDESVFHPRDRSVARWYSWLILLGYSALVVTLVVAVLPVAYRVLSRVFARFVDSGVSTLSILDSVVFLSLNLAQLVVIFWLAHRERSARQAEARASGVAAS